LALVARLTKSKLVNWVQDIYPELAVAVGVLGRNWLTEKALPKLRDWSLNAAAANVVISTSMKHFIEIRGAAPDRTVTIPNWADAPGVRSEDPSSEPVSRRLGLADRFVVMYSGNLGRAHDFEGIASAMMRLDERDRIAFLMIGDGIGMRTLRDKCEAIHQRGIYFAPAQPRQFVHSNLVSADVQLVSLLPELEGLVFPSKLYGVLAAGKPIIFIGAATSELASLVVANDCGIAVPEGDGQELIRAVRQVRDDADLRQRLGRNARALFDREFTLKISTEKWKRLLTSLANRK